MALLLRTVTLHQRTAQSALSVYARWHHVRPCSSPLVRMSGTTNASDQSSTPVGQVSNVPTAAPMPIWKPM